MTLSMTLMTLSHYLKNGIMLKCDNYTRITLLTNTSSITIRSPPVSPPVTVSAIAPVAVSTRTTIAKKEQQ